MLGDQFGSDGDSGWNGHERKWLIAGCGEGLDHGLEDAAPVGSAQDRIADALGMGHQAKDIPPMAAYSGNIFQRAVGVSRIGDIARGVTIPQEHLIVYIQCSKGLGIGKVSSLAVGDREVERLPLMEHGGEG